MHKSAGTGTVRIISGEWRSRRIHIPPEGLTRPMLDRVKAAVFDMIGSYLGTPGRLPSIVVADVFAGGGTLGLEALSRGARVCIFVERDKQALAVLRRNLHDLQVGPEGIIEPIDAWGAGLAPVLAEHGCSLILLDPPYQDVREADRRTKLAALLEAVARPDRWAEPPLLLLHYPAEIELDAETLGPWRVQIARQYGTSGIALLGFPPARGGYRGGRRHSGGPPMTKPSPRLAAETIAATLRERGFQALLAGGCVRDLLLGKDPKDYDVATDATPDQVCGLFRRTEKVGAKFGVVIVRLKGAQVEVATFRTDAEYGDGRRPDSVRFASPEEDARRRDFTINGMFLDPVDGRIIDWVGGQEDLRARLIRAIGEPEKRFAEDHLRMLRAVRFAAALEFEIEPATLQAIRRHAAAITGISAERIQQELERILGAASRARGWGLLCETGLVGQVVPGIVFNDASLAEATARLADLPTDSDFMTSMAAILVPFGSDEAARVCRDLRCSTMIERGVAWLIEQLPRALDAPSLELADVKLLMADPRFDRLLHLARAEAVGVAHRPDVYERLAERVAAIPAEKVAPPPLVTGDDLHAMNVPAGPIYGRVLEAVYRAQLNETLTAREEALRMAQREVGGA